MECLDMGDARDGLTGLIGAEAALDHLAEWQADARESGRAPTIHAMAFGLKRLATVNLAYGEGAGDLALAEVAARLLHFAQDQFEHGWFAARSSGNRFLFAVNAPCSRERWQFLAEELAQALARPIVQG